MKNINKPGWLDTYQNILKYVKLTDKVIDVLKMDTEGAEFDFLDDVMTYSPDLLCKYVKQIAMESHSWLHSFNHTYHFHVLFKLESCFRLYERDQRFYLYRNSGNSEWQDNKPIILKNFKDEVEMAKHLFIYGELFFININFL